MPCGNPSCRRGGYEFDFLIRDIARSHETEKAIELFCRGDEGSPQGRKIGRRCQHKIEAKIKIKYKAPIESNLNGKPSEDESQK
jgi:hypothetical protein